MVAEAKDIGMWLRMACSAESERNGAGSFGLVALVEDRLVGQRIASVVKLASLKDAKSALAEFLCVRDFTGFTERTRDFFVVLLVALTSSEDLSLRM